jgi:hypothetical protein
VNSVKQIDQFVHAPERGSGFFHTQAKPFNAHGKNQWVATLSAGWTMMMMLLLISPSLYALKVAVAASVLCRRTEYSQVFAFSGKSNCICSTTYADTL